MRTKMQMNGWIIEEAGVSGNAIRVYPINKEKTRHCDVRSSGVDNTDDLICNVKVAPEKAINKHEIIIYHHKEIDMRKS